MAKQWLETYKFVLIVKSTNQMASSSMTDVGSSQIVHRQAVTML